MNSLHQDKSLLIGSTKAIDSLAKKESAVLLVVSDSHGFSSILTHIVQQRGSHCDALIFCGDGLSDITSCVEQASVDNEFADVLPPVIAIAEGNGDADRYPYINPEHYNNPKASLYAEFKVPLFQTLIVAKHKLFVTHGHRYSLLNGTEALAMEAKKQNAQLVFYGHTHIARADQNESMLILNPGSCSRPRGGQQPCFAEVLVTAKSDFFGYQFFQVTTGNDFPGYNPDL